MLHMRIPKLLSAHESHELTLQNLGSQSSYTDTSMPYCVRNNETRAFAAIYPHHYLICEEHHQNGVIHYYSHQYIM
jgi:hypothetical protein